MAMESKDNKVVTQAIVELLQEVPMQHDGTQNALQRGLDNMFTNYFKQHNFLDNGGEDTTNEVIESYHFFGKLITEANNAFKIVKHGG